MISKHTVNNTFKPALYRYRENKFIVLFTSENAGVLVYDDLNCIYLKAGMYS